MKTVTVNYQLGKAFFEKAFLVNTSQPITFDDFEFKAIVPKSFTDNEVSNLNISIGNLGSNGDKKLSFFTKTLFEFAKSIEKPYLLIYEFMYDDNFKNFLVDSGIFLADKYYYKLILDNFESVREVLGSMHSTGLFFGFLCENYERSSGFSYESIRLAFADCFDGEYEIIAARR